MAKKSEFPPGARPAPADRARSDDPQRLTLSVEEAGRILGISRGAAYARAEDGSLPTIRLGKRLLVPKSALDKMLAMDSSSTPSSHTANDKY
jgi:excisionase family DNA binding protein